MTFKTLACAVVFGLSASVVLACDKHQQQTQSCVPGTVWDSESQSCVKEVTS